MDEQERLAAEDGRLVRLTSQIARQLAEECAEAMGVQVVPREVAAALAIATGTIVASRIGAQPSVQIRAGGGGANIGFPLSTAHREREP